MKQMTIEEFKAWAREHKTTARAVVLAQAFAMVERARVDEYIKPVFDSYQFQYGPLWTDHGGAPGPVPSPNRLYLCDDPRLPDYYEACDRAHRANGFTGPKDFCPALMAENVHIKAENALIEAAKPLTGVDLNHLWGDKRKQYIDLLLGACLKAGHEQVAA